jgi:hypothetical protein
VNDLKNELLTYRLTLDVLYIGEAAAELLDPKTKPKSVPGKSTAGEEEIIWDKYPNKKPLPEMSENLKTNLTALKECKNNISHMMKEKRADREFLK